MSAIAGEDGVRQSPVLVSLRGGAQALISETSAADAPALIAYWQIVANETDFLSFGPGELRRSVEEEQLRLSSLRARAGVALSASVDGELAGHAALKRFAGSRLRHGAELELSVQRKYWGLGIGRALCEALTVAAVRAGLTRIELRVRHDNARAVALYEALGFMLEGRLRRACIADGVEHDDLLMALLLHHARPSFSAPPLSVRTPT